MGLFEILTQQPPSEDVTELDVLGERFLVVSGAVPGGARAVFVRSLAEELAIVPTLRAFGSMVIGLALLIGDVSLRFPMGALTLDLDAPRRAIGLAAAIGSGVLGGLVPAVRAVRGQRGSCAHRGRSGTDRASGAGAGVASDSARPQDAAQTGKQASGQEERH